MLKKSFIAAFVLLGMSFSAYAQKVHTSCTVFFSQYWLSYNIRLIDAGGGLVDTVLSVDSQHPDKQHYEMKLATGLTCKRDAKTKDPVVLCSDQKTNGERASAVSFRKNTSRQIDWYGGDAYEHETYEIMIQSPLVKSQLEQGKYTAFEEGGHLRTPVLDEKSFKSLTETDKKLIVFEQLLNPTETKLLKQNKLDVLRYSIYYLGTGWCTLWKD